VLAPERVPMLAAALEEHLRDLGRSPSS
jgi:hypothetical protein